MGAERKRRRATATDQAWACGKTRGADDRGRPTEGAGKTRSGPTVRRSWLTTPAGWIPGRGAGGLDVGVRRHVAAAGVGLVGGPPGRESRTSAATDRPVPLGPHGEPTVHRAPDTRTATRTGSCRTRGFSSGVHVATVGVGARCASDTTTACRACEASGPRLTNVSSTHSRPSGREESVQGILKVHYEGEGAPSSTKKGAVLPRYGNFA